MTDDSQFIPVNELDAAWHEYSIEIADLNVPVAVRRPLWARVTAARAAAQEEAAGVAALEADLAHWRQAAIDLGGQLELVRATLDAVIHETSREH